MSQEEFWPKQEAIQDDQNSQKKRKNKKRVIKNPSQQTGHWSEQEHQTYLDFLNMHRSVMESQDQKKTSKIFKLMSETIGTRSPSQCRSHHQKFNPYIHQIKKRQKRKKDNQNTEKINKNDENVFVQSLQIQNQLFQQQPLEYQMLQIPYFPYVPVFDNQLKEDDKVNEQQQLYFQQYMFFQQQLPQQLDEKNICCFNFNFMPQQQLQQAHLNFNYFQQQQQMFNNDFQALNSCDINNKDNQFDEQ